MRRVVACAALVLGLAAAVSAQVRIVQTNSQGDNIHLIDPATHAIVGEIKGIKVPGADTEEALAADVAETVFEPSPEHVLGYLIGQYVNVYLFFALLNAKASEQSARMVSMKNATDSAENLIKDLTLEYNKLRQGNITKELLEIAGGQAG